MYNLGIYVYIYIYMKIYIFLVPFAYNFYRNGGKSFRDVFPPPTAAIAVPGPKRTCFCCVRCISSICARSVSKTTGANRITEDVKNTQDATHVTLYKPWIPFMVQSKTVEVAFLTDSGNISVRPINRSSIVSSGS